MQLLLYPFANSDLRRFLLIPICLFQSTRRLSTCISFYPLSIDLYLSFYLFVNPVIFISVYPSFILLYLFLFLVYPPLSYFIFFQSSPYAKEIWLSIGSNSLFANKHWDSNAFSRIYNWIQYLPILHFYKGD